MKRTLLIGFCFVANFVWSVTTLPITNIYSWSKNDLSSYVGQTVTFPVPVYVNATGSPLTVSPRHAVSGTEVALPGTTAYSNQSSKNAAGSFQLSGAGNHRLGEVVENLTVRVNSTSSVSYVSGLWVANSREQLFQGPDSALIDQKGKHSILVCAMNLEYYLVSGFGQGMGPRNEDQHKKQRAKISQALALINADLYGLVEVQKGTAALQEIANDLKKNTGRNYSIITSTSSASGTYTQSGYIYCSDVIKPYSQSFEVSGGPSDRRFMTVFQEIATGETFFFSINHFKAKTGSGTGADADKGDGQGSFNGTRVKEAQAVITTYNSKRGIIHENDILIMGDLNAYSMEDPIQTFVSRGMTNLHKYFHQNESYSYRYYDNTVGVLDHALVNSTLLPQVTGMLAFHINSDEDDRYTYDKSSDQTMFRSSDHDPVLVGLRLDPTAHITSDKTYINNDTFYFDGRDIIIYNAKKDGKNGYYAIYSLSGQLYTQGTIENNEQAIECPQLPGMYLIRVYANGEVKQFKIMVP